MADLETLDTDGLSFQEQGSDPATPASTDWRLYFKSGGMYHIDDAGAVTGPLGAPPAEILDIPTAETDDTLVLAPDGAGGVEFRAESGGVGGSSELDYIEFTSAVTVSATTEAAANTIVSAGALVLDGSTDIMIHFF